MATKVMKCKCEHEYQDAKYGKGNRVFNKMKKDGGWKCTVCNAETVNKSEEGKKK